MKQETYRTNKVLIFYDFAKHSHVRLSVNHKSNCAAFSEYIRFTDRMLSTVQILKRYQSLPIWKEDFADYNKLKVTYYL
jgi:hypothetical protein